MRVRLIMGVNGQKGVGGISEVFEIGERMGVGGI